MGIQVLFSSLWIPAILSFVAFTLSILTLSGCNFVRLHLTVEDGAYIGIGYYNSQNLDRDSSDWENISECISYDDTTPDLFNFSQIEQASHLSLTACAFGAFSLIVLVIKCFFVSSMSKVQKFGVALTLLLAGIFQVVTIPITMNSDVCEKESYQDVPEDYSYLKLFDCCCLGQEGKIAIASSTISFATTLWFIISVFTTSKTTKENKDEGENLHELDNVQYPKIPLHPETSERSKDVEANVVVESTPANIPASKPTEGDDGISYDVNTKEPDNNDDDMSFDTRN